MGRLNDNCAVLGFIGLWKGNTWRDAVLRLSQNCTIMWLPEISVKPEEPVDYVKCPFTSTLPFPRSEIAATIHCMIIAYW